LYDRRLVQFPPPGVEIDDNFFAVGGEAHPLDDEPPGRLYVGICAPGRGAQTPIVRIWSRLLQHMESRRQAGVPLAELDPFAACSTASRPCASLRPSVRLAAAWTWPRAVPRRWSCRRRMDLSVEVTDVKVWS
jgi:hypothetical protein